MHSLQANRTKKKAAYEFGEGQQLPPTMPDKYNEKLSNRVFKRRVIDMVCNRVLEHLAVNTSDAYTRSFVVDYTGCPIVFQAAKGAGRFDASSPTFMTDVPPMGEADIKFTRWLDHFPGDMVAFSVDGDFIPIALMRREAECNRVHASGSSHAAPPRNVAIYRLRYRMPVPAAARIKGGRQAGAATASAKKGTLKGQNTHAPQDGSGAAAANPPARQKHAREYEYVSIPVLYAGMRDVFERLGTRTSILTGRMRKSYMRMLAVLIGLGGTDFSRGLPLIGPYTLWELLVGNPNAFSNLLQLYSTKRGLVRVKCACNGMACNLYMLKFASHFGGGKVKGAKGSVPPAAATNRGVMDKFLVKKGADGGKIEIVSDDDDDGGDGSSEGEEEVDSDSESFRGGFQVRFVCARMRMHTQTHTYTCTGDGKHAQAQQLALAQDPRDAANHAASGCHVPKHQLAPPVLGMHAACPYRRGSAAGPSKRALGLHWLLPAPGVRRVRLQVQEEFIAWKKACSLCEQGR